MLRPRCTLRAQQRWENLMVTRRQFTMRTGAIALGWGLRGEMSRAVAAEDWSGRLASAFAKLEAQSGGRLGVAVLDTRTGARAGHRADERFPMCSTFKMLLAAAILARVDAGKEQFARRIRFEKRDIMDYSPATEHRIGGTGMSVAELCEAAVTLSDNTAANLLLAAAGGPAEVTAYARSLGDAVTRLDRIEPELNESLPGDPRDTTSPAAMAADLHTLVLGTALSATSKEQLTRWLVANKTGDARIRAGVPKGWRVGDKTGTGARGSTNDIGVIWPAGREPVILSIYLTDTSVAAERRNATHAAVARAVAAALEG
jgi:beta-lactamase class A